MRRAEAPSHAALASFPAELRIEGLEDERDRLDALTIEVAQYLIEHDWRAAVRSAYTAAWSFHRLPEEDQRTFAESDLHDDAGPLPVDGDEWSSSAFVAWMIYRCGTSAAPFVTSSRKAPNVDATVAPIESVQKDLL